MVAQPPHDLAQLALGSVERDRVGEGVAIGAGVLVSAADHLATLGHRLRPAEEP